MILKLMGLFDLFFLLNVVSKLDAYPTYAQRIPNGQVVPNPCNASLTWKGLGHKNPDGGGARNIFGADFEANGKAWTTDLCRKDSDGDGRTNGEELGDPNCEWKFDQNNPIVPQFHDNITHPGICDPYDSIVCATKNIWLQCRPKDDCPEKHGPDVRSLTLRFPRTNIPAAKTTYMCRNFQLPQGGLYDVIADDPVIDNRMVAHHMLLYGCDSGAKVTEFSNNYLCQMGMPTGCFNLICVWASGGEGTCHGPEYGFRIGQNTANDTGYKYAILQIHWTKKEKSTDCDSALIPLICVHG